MKEKRSLSFGDETALVIASTALVAATYGLVRLSYGLFLPDVQHDLGLGTGTAGHVASGASLAYCAGALAGLTAARRARGLVVAALGTAGTGSLAMASAPGVPLFAAGAVIASTAAGLASPALVEVVRRRVPAARQDRAQAVVNSGTGPGLVAVGLLALALLPHWRLGLGVAAVATVAAGVAVLALDRPGRTPSAPPARPSGPPATSGDGVAWARRLAVPGVAALLLGTTSAVVWTYGRALLVHDGAGPTTSTVAWVALGLGGAATVVTADRLGRLSPGRAWVLTVATVATSIATLGLAGRFQPVALLACAVFGWGFVAATSALILWARDLVETRAAAGTSLLFVTLVLGQAVGSAIAGAVAERHGLGATFVLMAAVGAVATLPGRWGERRGERRATAETA